MADGSAASDQEELLGIVVVVVLTYVEFFELPVLSALSVWCILWP